MADTMDRVVEFTRDAQLGCPVAHGFAPLDPDQCDDPGVYATLARREAPVFYDPELDMYVVTRHEDVKRIFTDYETFRGIGLSEHEVPERARDVLPQGFLPQQPGFRNWGDLTQHTRIRRLAQKAFTHKAALQSAERMVELFDRTIDEFVADGQVDLIPAYARRVPVRVIIAILGLEEEIEPHLHAWVADFMTLMGNPQLGEDELVELAHRQAPFYAFAEELVARRREDTRPGEDLISDLIVAADDEGSPKLSNSEIIAVVLIAIIAGGDTSVNLIGQIVHRALSGGGELWRSFAAHPELIERSVEEEIRHDFVGRIIPRRPTVDVEIAGVRIPAGSLVGMHVWSANHDESVFAEAEVYDPERGDLDKHLGFGHGLRFCMGAPLARVETRLAIERLVERLPDARLVPGHRLRRKPSVALPSLLDGLVVAWDPPRS